MSPNQDVSAEVGEAPDQDAALEREIETLRAAAAEPSPQERAAAKLKAKEAELAARREATATIAAEKRLKGIARAVGSLIDAVPTDVDRVQSAAAEYLKAADTLNGRHAKIDALHAEAAALRDRFPEAKVPSIPAAPPPPSRDEGIIVAAEQVRVVAFGDRSPIRPFFEEDELRLRRRRSYLEVSETPGYSIIAQAGLRPFPELTAAQKARVADEARQKEEWARQAPHLKAEADLVLAQSAHLFPPKRPARREVDGDATIGGKA